nr:PIG-L family deacetylase [Naumannella cuiyingiana]
MRPGPLARVAVLGAHCDDIAIGAGGSLLTLCRANPGVIIDALVLSGAGTEREAEERAALAAFCPGAELRLTVADLPDGRMPGEWARAKSLVAAHRRTGDPDLVLAPQRRDAHQDHRLLAELVGQEYRDHLVLGYEIVKYETDLPTVSVHVALEPTVVGEKIALITEHYPSQHGRSWFDDEAFRAVLRIRGVQAQARHAEGFVLEKAVLDLTGGAQS